MVRSWYGGWNIYEYIPNLHGNHTLCYFMNDCRIILKQKNPSEGSDVRSPQKREQQIRQQPLLAVAQWLMSCLWKDLNTRKEHVENSQMYGKHSRGFCQSSNQKKTRSAHPFESARLGCSRSIFTMPFVGEITLERMTDTRKPSKTLKPLKSKFPTWPYKHYFQYIVQYVMGRIV